MFKFIHAADIHLDSPLRGLEQYEHAPVGAIRGATRLALEKLVALAIDEQANFVLLAGDVYDRDWPDYNTGLFFAQQMGRLRDAGIAVVTIAGNHDAANKMTRSLRLPENVTVLPTAEPGRHDFDDLGVVVHGQGFAAGAVTDDLSAAYPQAAAGQFNIGLLHTCASGYEGHDRYAPCTLAGLRSKHYDYWALGHIHTREILSGDGEPQIVFSGNLQGRHIRETGAKGCYLVTVGDRRQIAAMKFLPLDVFRWERCTLDATGAVHGDEITDRFQRRLKQLTDANDGLQMALRVEVEGSCPAHDRLAAEPQRWTNELRLAAHDLAGDGVWLEKVKWRTAAPADHRAVLADGPLAELTELIDQIEGDNAQLLQLAGELSDLKKRLPSELCEGESALDLDSPEQLRATLEQARHLLLARLQSPAAGK